MITGPITQQIDSETAQEQIVSALILGAPIMVPPGRDVGCPRTDDLGGQSIRTTGVDPSWGLHLIDVDHSMGPLIDIVARPSNAYAAARQDRPARTSPRPPAGAAVWSV